MTVTVAQIVDLILILYGLNNLTFLQCIFESLYSQTISFFTLSESFILTSKVVHDFPRILLFSFFTAIYFNGKERQISLSSCSSSVVKITTMGHALSLTCD